jgi:spore coat polysaccharide biosynthesis protein SpsF
MKIVATLACRNNSSRLYGKPLQTLMKHTVLEYMIHRLRERNEIHDIVLAISEDGANDVFVEVAESLNVKYVRGDDRDVLDRLIKACELAGGDTVYRVTTESPFTILEKLPEAVASHLATDADYSYYPDLPDGVTFELVKLSALKKSHSEGERKHRSEMCVLYINEHPELFRINRLNLAKEILRPDYRLTIDYPEDLILCRRIVQHFGGDDHYISYADMIAFLDSRPDLQELVTDLAGKNYIPGHVVG